MNRDCKSCIYYKGKHIPVGGGRPDLIEQCSQRYWRQCGLKTTVKHSKSKNVICAVECDHQYFIYTLVGMYDVLEQHLITKEEFDRFEEWERNEEVVTKFISRKPGCEHCRQAAVQATTKDYLNHVGLSITKQAELWQCPYCKAFWEYGVYETKVVERSYADVYYSAGERYI